MRKIITEFNKRVRLNNQGSTLLTVVICLAFLGILGALMLNLTMTNLEMKIVESKSKNNFYTCEKAMDEIRAAVQEMTVQSIKEVYETEVLNNYAAYIDLSEDERNDKIQKLVAVRLISKLSDTSGYTSDDDILNRQFTIEQTVFDDYLSQIPNSTRIITADFVNFNSSDVSVILHDINVKLDMNEYRTTLSSDIRVTIPRFTFKDEDQIVHLQMEQPYPDYTLVADNGIISDKFSSNSDIVGSVYAGQGGITINGQASNNHIVKIDGQNIITRGNITVADTAKLNIGKAGIVKPIIWTNNLVTQTTGRYVANSFSTNMDINGVCIVKDDLTLEARNSNVTLSGAYVGYTGTHTALGSSIIINGTGSALDLTALNALILAGRAHVSIVDTALSKDKDILTGESIAFKSNQKAYLLPGKFITKVLHNPVTGADIDKIGDAPTVTITNPSDPNELNYNNYVVHSIDSDPYKIAAKQTGASGTATTLFYYYLNFASGKLADQFLIDYNSKYPTMLDQMKPFTLGNVKLPGSTAYIASVGNLMSYSTATKQVQLTTGESSKAAFPDDQSLDDYIAGLSLDEPIFADTKINAATVGILDGLYAKINHLLDLDSTSGYVESDTVVKKIVKPLQVAKVAGGNLDLDTTDYVLTKINGNGSFTNLDPSVQSIVVINGNATISDNTILNGFLIASGNITIGDNVKVNGVIITTGETGNGDITLGNAVTVKGHLLAAGNINLGVDCKIGNNDTGVENNIKTIFQKEGTFLGELLRTINMTIALPADNLVDLSKMISYENWRKVE